MAPKRIMVVEDEAVTAMDLKSVLLRFGYNVPAVVASGEAAIAAAAEARPDLILMDITLEGPMSGIEAADEIRRTHAVPVVFLTAHTEPETMGRAVRTGPFGYLPKPFTAEALRAAIEVALNLGTADRQHRGYEERLQRLLEERRMILDNLAAGVFLVKNRRLVWINRSLWKMFGYDMRELLGHDAEVLYGDRESYEWIEKEGYAALARGEVYATEIEMKRKDGSPVWCHLVGQTVDPADRKLAAIWFVEDVTERKMLQERLRQSEEKYRTIAYYTYDWEFWIAPDERILYMSPSCERVTGHPREEFERDFSLIRRIIHPDDLGIWDDHRHSAKTDRRSAEIEFRIVRPDGSLCWTAHICQPVFDGQGIFAGTRGSNRDISARKAAEQERERLLAELQAAMGKVKLLQGFIPICASCKKIRDDKGFWQQLEVYIRDHSDAEFTHGICPECSKKFFDS